MKNRVIPILFALSLTCFLYAGSGFGYSQRVTAEQVDFIDNLNIPAATKILLYEYAATSEGQDLLSKIIPTSSLGPTASSISTPIGYGSDWGMVSAGVAYGTHWVNSSHEHGLGNLTVGMGDAEKYIGLSASALIDNVKISNNNFGKNGAVAMHLFHNFPHNIALAVGMANAISWGTYQHSARSYYIVGTKIFNTSFKTYKMPLTLSLGGGTGAFQSAKSMQEKNDSKVGIFGSVGWQVLPQVSLIGETVTKQINLGVSVVPFKKLPILLNFSECNLNHTSGKHSYFLVGLTVGYTFN